jgi:hypothetical protein
MANLCEDCTLIEYVIMGDTVAATCGGRGGWPYQQIMSPPQLMTVGATSHLAGLPLRRKWSFLSNLLRSDHF